MLRHPRRGAACGYTACPGVRMADRKLSIYGAIAANVAIAVTKFIVAGITGSSAMLSEGIHSTVDIGNGLLLLTGTRLSRRPPTPEHPFGHGKELYFWSLIVAVLVFGLGGGLSFYQGIAHVRNPVTLTDPTWNYVVLGAAALFEGASFAIALRHFIAEAQGRPFWQALHASKDPTTYTVRVRIGAGELVRLMTDQFIAHWVPEWETRLDTLHMTRQQLVTLASIVQAEVRYAPDAEYVSAVYHNRLRKGMRLEADPTVIYAYGRRLSRVYEKNLRIRSPYNTYLVPGLPPGPISQPDSASIAAALYPARVPFLFFVAQPDGKHIFSVTYREHQAAIVAVRRMRTAARAPRPRGR